MKETAFLYFHISLFACSHNTRSPASDYIRCIRTRVFKMQTPDMLKITESGLIHFLLYWLCYENKNGCVIYYPGIASTAEVPGTPYRISGTLEFSSCASIAPDRRALSERAEHASFARKSGNRRRSARSTKFHSVSAVLYDRPGTSDLIWFYEANFYLASFAARISSIICGTTSNRSPTMP